MRQFIYVILLLVLTTKAYANHHKVDIDVNGLVCEFCAVTIEKGKITIDEVDKIGSSIIQPRKQALINNTLEIKLTFLR